MQYRNMKGDVTNYFSVFNKRFIDFDKTMEQQHNLNKQNRELFASIFEKFIALEAKVDGAIARVNLIELNENFNRDGLGQGNKQSTRRSTIISESAQKGNKNIQPRGSNSAKNG